VAAHTSVLDAQSEPIRLALERRYFINLDDLLKPRRALDSTVAPCIPSVDVEDGMRAAIPGHHVQ
jgi:hypothetical protein